MAGTGLEMEGEGRADSDAYGAPGAGPAAGRRNGAVVGRGRCVRQGILPMEEVTACVTGTYVAPTRYEQAPTPPHYIMNVTFFGNKIFADMID